MAPAQAVPLLIQLVPAANGDEAELRARELQDRDGQLVLWVPFNRICWPI